MPMILILTLMLLSMARVASSATYYAQATGGSGTSCTNSTGTRCTLTQAISNAQPGDTVVAGNGTYAGPIATVRSGTSDTARITITAENRRQATINWGSGQNGAVFRTQHSWITFRGFVLNADVTTLDSQQGATGMRVQPASNGPQMVGIILEDNQVTGPGGGCIKLDTVSTAVFTNISNITIRWNTCLNTRTEASSSATFGEAMYLGQYQGVGRIDGAYIYANTIIDPLLECFDMKDGSNDIQIHHNICDGSGRLTADGTPIIYRQTPVEETNTSWLATFEGPITNSRVYSNIARHGRTQSYAGCGGTFMPQNTGVRFDHNVCRDSLSPSSAIGGGLSDTSIWQIDNNVFCTLSSYANANTSPNLNIHDNQGFPGSGVAASVCDAAEATILAEMQSLPGNPSSPAAPGDTLIGSGADDAEQETVSGTTRINEAALDLGDSGGVLTAGGFYFRSLAMGKNATCNTATIQFTAAASPGTLAPVFDIKAEASMTPAALAATANNLTGRTFGSAISWSPAAWSANTADAASTTPNLCSILQPLFNNAAWVPGTHVMIGIFPASGSGSRVVKPVDQGGVTRLSVNFTDTIPAPTALQVPVISSYGATYTWTAAPGATGYKLYTCTPVPCGPGTPVTLSNVTTTTVTNLSPSTQYDVRVSATSGASESTLAGPVEFQTYAEGLVGYWAANEGAGTNLTDTGRGLSPGSLSGVGWTSDSKSGGQALVCDDSPGVGTDYISLPTTGMNPSKGTVMFWVKPTNFPNSTRYYLGHNTGAPADRMQLYHDANVGVLQLGMGGTHTTDPSMTTLTAGTWAHLALTWNGTAWQLIRGGSLVDSGTFSPALAAFATTLDICNVGANFGHDEGALAIIDDIRTYDKALTDVEVLAIINTGLPAFSLTAVPPKVVTGQTSGIVWPPVANATSCTASVTSGTDAGWTGNQYIGGGTYFAPTPSGASTTYQLSCTGAAGAQAHTATVTKDTTAPYPYSTLATVVMVPATNEVHGLQTPLGDGADIWEMTEGSDGNIYSFWGDGKGWTTTGSYAFFGMSKITGSPPGGLTGTDPYRYNVTNRKPSGYIADTGSTIRGYHSTVTDSWNGTYPMSSVDFGVSWSFDPTATFGIAADGVRIVGIAQAGPGYTGLPSGVDDTYYYVYLTKQFDDGNIPQIYLGRVPKTSWNTRASFSFYNGLTGGLPIWSSSFASKQSVVLDNATRPFEADLAVTYWPAMGRWLMLKPYQTSKLGIFEGDTPWGPWHTLFNGAGPIDTALKFTYASPQKWMDPLGASFWMSYSGNPEYDFVSLMRVDVTTLPATALPPDTTPPLAPQNLRVMSP